MNLEQQLQVILTTAEPPGCYESEHYNAETAESHFFWEVPRECQMKWQIVVALRFISLYRNEALTSSSAYVRRLAELIILLEQDEEQLKQVFEDWKKRTYNKLYESGLCKDIFLEDTIGYDNRGIRELYHRELGM